MGQFSFEISDNNLETAYKKVREAFMTTFQESKPRISNEHPPSTFYYKVRGGNGTITLNREKKRTTVTTTIPGLRSAAIVWGLGFVLGYYLYGLFGAIFMIAISFLISIPMIRITLKWQKNKMGVQFCKALNGSNLR